MHTRQDLFGYKIELQPIQFIMAILDYVSADILKVSLVFPTVYMYAHAHVHIHACRVHAHACSICTVCIFMSVLCMCFDMLCIINRICIRERVT